MGRKLFRKSFFGYNKLDVSMYFESVSAEFTTAIEKKDEELEHLRNRLSILEEEVGRLRHTKDEFDTVRDSISRAIIQAEDKASIIIEDAKRTAVQEKQKVESDIVQENARLRKIKQDTEYIRRSVTALINKFDADLEKFS